MPRLTNRNPSYRRHKASGQAVVTLDGQDVYLGPWNSATSKREYDRVVGEYLARGRQLASTADTARVSDVIKSYWDFAGGYYTGEQGRSELGSIKLALGVLRRLYGDTLAGAFGPLAGHVNSGKSKRLCPCRTVNRFRRFSTPCVAARKSLLRNGYPVDSGADSSDICALPYTGA